MFKYLVWYSSKYFSLFPHFFREERRVVVKNWKTGSEELHMENDINNNNQTYINLKNNSSELRKAPDYFKFLGNCPPTPLLSQH